MKKQTMKPRNYIVRHVRNDKNELIGTLVARKRHDDSVLITYSVRNDSDQFYRKAGVHTALKKTHFVPLVNHRPIVQQKLDVIKQWLPRFVEQASRFFKTEVPSPVV